MGSSYEKVIDNLDETSKYYYLHNCYPITISYKGLTYLNLQSTYEAQKELNAVNRIKYTTTTGYYAMILSANLDKTVSDKVFYELLKIKFSDEILKEKLLDTKDYEIVYKNTWHDNTFGVCICDKCKDITGENKLGKYLMQLREELLNESK